MHRLEIIAVR